jgi:sec-independent protein translocase protein TatA
LWRVGQIELGDQVTELTVELLPQSLQFAHSMAGFACEFRQLVWSQDQKRDDRDNHPMQRGEHTIERHAVSVELPLIIASSTGSTFRKYTSEPWLARCRSEGAAMTPVFGEIIGWEFLLVIAVIALLFGSTQLPKLARSLGSAKNEFEKGLRERHTEGDDKTPA